MQKNQREEGKFMNNKYTKKEFTIYIIITFVLAYILEIIASILAIKGNQFAFTSLLAITMFIPMLSVLIIRKNFKGLGWKPQFKGKIKYWVMAFIVPAIISILGAVLFFVIFPDTFDTSGKYLELTMGAEQYSTLQKSGMTPILCAIMSTFSCITIVPAINGFLAIGEEIGWRGMMYPYLKEKFGTNIGRIIGGSIWGVWHFPAIIIAGYEYGTEYIGAPFLGPITFIAITICFGTILDNLYEKSNCMIVPALAHGAINGIAGIPLLLYNPDFANYTILGPSMVGIVSAVPMIIYVMFIFIKSKK